MSKKNKADVDVAFFALLFGIISFLPQPLLLSNWILIRFFLLFFLLIILLCDRSLVERGDSALWFFAVAISVGIINSMDKPEAMRSHLRIVTAFVPNFYIGKHLYRREEMREIIPLVICIFSSMIALWGLTDIALGRNILYERFVASPYYARYLVEGFLYPIASQYCTVALGTYFLFCYPFSIFLALNKKPLLRYIGLVCFTISIAMIIFSFVRGVLLAMIFSLVFYLWINKKFRLASLWVLLISIFILICSVSSNPVIHRFSWQNLIKGNSGITSYYRMARFKMAFRIVQDHPLSGVGLENFRPKFNKYCETWENNQTPELCVPDNMFLAFLLETGAIGFGSFMIFIFFLFFHCLGVLRRMNEASRPALIATFVAFFALLINMITYDLLYWESGLLLFSLSCGLMAGYNTHNV